MSRTLALLLLLSLSVFAAAETPTVNVPDASPEFAAASEHNWGELPPTFLFTPASSGNSSETGRRGKVWIRKTAEGLLIAGHVDGPPPLFPTSVDTLVTGERVEIWLAQQPDPHFPALGWGNQHGDIELPDESTCPAALHMQNDPDAREVRACREWVQQQQNYRAQLKRLFARHWLLAPGVSAETFATPAHAQISQFEAEIDHDILAQWKPNNDDAPALTAKPDPAGGYAFETLIRWQAFPPAGNIDLQDLYLMVEVVGSAGSYSTTAPGRGPEQFSTFSRIRLEHPRRYAISPCHYAAVGKGFFDRPLPGYFLPTAEETISKTFVLENDRRGYMDEAAGLSPNLTATTFFAHPLQNDGFLCGPLLRTYIAGKSTDLAINAGKETTPIVVTQESMDALELPEGLLIRNGPRLTTSRFGAGACGLCPRIELEIYAVDKSMKVTEQVHIYDIVDPSVFVDDADIQVAKDWSRVGYFRHEQIKDPTTGVPRDEFDWNDQLYCRKGLTYEKCGTEQTIPPDPRSLTLGRQ